MRHGSFSRSSSNGEYGEEYLVEYGEYLVENRLLSRIS